MKNLENQWRRRRNES